MKSFSRWFVLSTITGAVCVLSTPAFAAKGKEKKAESKMMAACKKEFPDAVKGKSFKEVTDWVETEERGANADTFKKSKCYNLHEDWEKIASKTEEGEAEHKR